jgi:hypothetical protein
MEEAVPLHWIESRVGSNKTGPRARYIPQGHALGDLLPPTSYFPHFYHLLIVYSNFESING